MGSDSASGMGFPPSMKTDTEYHNGFEVVNFTEELVHLNPCYLGYIPFDVCNISITKVEVDYGQSLECKGFG
jgi:hypothetical protein